MARVLLFLGIAFLASCTLGTGFNPPKPNLVSGITSGQISIENPIKIEFSSDMSANKDFIHLNIEPSIEGKLVWSDASTLTYIPKDGLARGKKYRVDITGEKDKKPLFESFSFFFSGMEQHIQANLDQVGLESDGSASIKLSIKSSDKMTLAKAKELVDLGNFPNAKPEWTLDDAKRKLTLYLKNISRGADTRDLSIGINGGSIGSSDKSSLLATIPGTKDFKFISSRVVTDQEEYIEISFSDLIETQQNFDGVVTTENGDKLDVVVKGNLLKVYNGKGWKKKETLKIRDSLQSKKKIKLVANTNVNVVFPEKLPAVRYSTQGVIIPTTQGYTLPIETINLSTVMVEVTQIFQSNVTQFLQVNNLEGNNELYRVGSVVWRQVVNLDWKPEYVDKWHRYGLDLSPLVKKFPGGMFNISVTFRKPHIVWKTDQASTEKVSDEELWGPIKESYEQSDSSNWDYYNEDYDYDDNSYSNRMDPEYPSFYKKYYDHDITIKKNVLLSDIGLLARKTADGSFDITATDLKTAQPLPGVAIDLQSYQRQSIVSGVSDSNGLFRTAPIQAQAFFVAAKKADQYAYLKLGDGDALSLAQFEIGGDKIENGVNGLIYGERGVWRPGDTIHLSFLLWDGNKIIPKNHPVNFSLLDPEGNIKDTQTLTQGLNGFYYFKTHTLAEDSTGNWLARVKVGNKSFTKTLKIETVVPNRLRISLEPIKSAPKTASLHAEWLTGLPSPGLTAKVEAFLDSKPTVFQGPYSDYSFDDGTRTLDFDKSTVFDSYLDDSGNATVNYEGLSPSNAPGRLQLTLNTRVYEENGSFSIDSYSADFDPFDQYVGLALPKGDAARNMLLTDVDHEVRVALLSPDGTPIKTGTVTLEVYKAAWRWWWESSEGDSAYREQENFSLLSTSQVRVANGQGKGSFKIKYPDWGRYLVKVRDNKDGHVASKYVYVDWPGWAGRPSKDGPGGASMLLATSNKKNYIVGESVVLTIPGNENAKALLSIEARGKIIRNEWIDLKGKSTEYKFTATSEMTPNIYAYIHLFQPHAQTANDLPIRMYGVVPITVEDAKTRLSPLISTEDTVKPQSTVKITVSETKGRGMTYTLALVDDGLLGLTRFKVPNPWDSFYRKQASQIKSWDLYSFVAGAFSGKLDGMLAIGGGDDLAGKAAKKNDRFPPVVIFSEPRYLAPGRTNSHEIKLPPYVGSVRVMVVAADTAEGAFASTEKSITVKADLMAQSTLPRIIGPSEKSIAPVNVFYLGPVPQKVRVTMTANGVVGLVGNSVQEITFNKQGDETVFFNLQAKEKIGKSVISINVKDERGNVSNEDVNLETRLPSLPVTNTIVASVEGGKTWSQSIGDLLGIEGTNSSMVELSTVPPIDLGKRLDYLIHYPYGCIEQTTSSVFPQLYLNDLVELSQAQKDLIKTNIEAGIARLTTFVTASGGFAYWPGEREANPWGSVYASHFLVEARRAGFAVPDTILQPALNFLKNQANSYNASQIYWEQTLAAYRLYVLALAGQALTGPMNVLSEQKLSTQAKYRLAGAFKLAGINGVAKKLVNGLSPVINPYRELDESFGSEIRDTAMIIETLLLLEMNDEAVPLAKSLSEILSKSTWLSTQETAYGLIAMSRFTLAGNTSGKNINVQLSFDDKAIGVPETKKSIVQIPITNLTGGKAIKVQNLGQNTLFIRVLNQGIPKPGTEMGKSDGLKIEANLFDNNDDKVFGYDSASLKNKKIAAKSEAVFVQGQDYKLVLTIGNTSSRDLKQLALSSLLPSGFEIINDNLNKSDNSKKNYNFKDIRDDRVNYFFDLKRGEEKSFEVRVSSSYTGRFYFPMLRVEAMYDGSIQAQIPGQWVQINKK